MNSFSIGNIYKGNGLRIVDINPLPENYCSFDCVFCPLQRTAVKTDETFYFKETKGFISNLSKFLNDNKVDLVFINPDGEALANAEIMDIVQIIKNKGVKVRILSNGYIFNDNKYRQILEMCDEVIGELSVTNETNFQKLQRPLEGYTLNEYVTNMREFRKWFKGKFILDITILKNYSDSDESIRKFKDMIAKISPDEIFFETANSPKLKDAFKVSDERLDQISKILRLK